MRILILQSVPLEGSGSGTYVRKVAEQLAKHHDVWVVYPGPKYKVVDYKVFNIPMDVVPVFTSHPLVPSRSLKDYNDNEYVNLLGIYTSYVSRVIENMKPDVVHVQHFGLWCPVAAWLKTILKVPVVLTSHGTGLYLVELEERHKRVMNMCTHYVDEVIAVSSAVKKRIENLFPHLVNKVSVIHGGVDVKKYSNPACSLKEWRQKYGLKNRVVLYVGRLIKEKGVQHLINVAPHLRECSIVISGSGEYEAVLKKMAKSYENVVFLPYLGDSIVDFFVYADIVCIPSIWEEAFGLVILEAMAAKTPVVASRVGGIPNVVRNGETGLLFEPGNERELLSKIHFLFENPEVGKRLADNAFANVLEEFTWEKVAEKIDDIYKELVTR